MRRAPWCAVALIGAAVAVALALGATVNAAGASRVMARQPLAVQAASLVQEGQDLVWQVELPSRSRRGRCAGTVGRCVC